MTVCKLEKPLRRFTLPSAVLFDLGNTLARYYSSDEFQPILERAVDSVIAELGARGVATVDRATALVAAGAENREAQRFSRDARWASGSSRFSGWPRRRSGRDPGDCAHALSRAASSRSARAISTTSGVPVLTSASATRGFRTAIVSNAPWGSPLGSVAARDRAARASSLVDATVLCGDVGCASPRGSIFLHAAR